MSRTPRIVFVGNWDWYLCHFRLDLARHLRSNLGAEVIFVCPGGDYAPKLAGEGFQWIPIEMDRQGINPLTELALMFSLRRIFRDLQPDLIHNFTVKPVAWGTLAGRLAGVPRIVNALAGLGSVFRGDTLKGRLLRLPLQLLFGAGLRHPRVHTIFQNPDDLTWIQEACRLKDSQVTLIRGSGVDIDHFSPLPSPVGPPTALFVGRLLRDKGILDFCKAAELTHQALPEARFLIAGTVDEGNPSSLTAQEVDRISAAQPYLTFLGHCADMKAVYQRADLIALPTQYGEGVPRSLIEAAACGRPLVATDHPGCREIVLPGASGLLVPPGDPGALAEAFQSLLPDRDRMNEMGRAGRKLAVEEFAAPSVFARTAGVYERLGLPRQGECPALVEGL